MKIAGLVKLTLLDFPGHVACAVFTPGCNFRCPFCHNRDLVLITKNLKDWPLEKFFDFLKQRRGKLEGVVVSGGEPLLQPDLGNFLAKVKQWGFLTKLDTNGSRPDLLGDLLPQGVVDLIAFDVKAPLGERYLEAAGLKKGAFDPAAVLQSIKVAVEFKVPLELRTTVVPTLHSLDDLLDLAHQLRDFLTPLSTKYLILNTPPWFLQPFEPHSCLDPQFNNVPACSEDFLRQALLKIRPIYPKVEARL